MTIRRMVTSQRLEMSVEAGSGQSAEAGKELLLASGLSLKSFDGNIPNGMERREQSAFYRANDQLIYHF